MAYLLFLKHCYRVFKQYHRSSNLLRDPKQFATPESVAAKVFDAVHQCDLYKEHFYVGNAHWFFRGFAFCRMFGLNWGAKYLLWATVSFLFSSTKSFIKG